MVLEVSEVERREELKVEAEAAQVRGRLGRDRGQSLAQNPAPDQDLALNLDLESLDPGQPADQGPGVALKGPEVAPRGQEAGRQGPDLGRPSQAAAQGRALAVRQDPGPRVEQGQGQGVLGGDQDQEVQQSQDQAVQQNPDQAVQGGQDLGVLLNLDLGVQQGQGPQAHQGRDRPEAGETNGPVQVHTGWLCAPIVSIVWTRVPLYHRLNHIFGFAGSCDTGNINVV